MMCTAWLSSKAVARACQKHEPGPSRGPTAGSGLARAQGWGLVELLDPVSGAEGVWPKGG